DALRRSGLECLAAADVGDLHLRRGCSITDVDGANCRAIQSDTNGRSGIVEYRVIHFRGDDILHRSSRSGAWYERANQEPRDRGVTVRKVEDVRLALSTFSRRDRKSTRLNSSHDSISYAVFCLKKKNLECDQSGELGAADSVPE